MKQKSLYIEENGSRLKRPAGAAFCVAALFAVALFLPSCNNEPIFATIENEIPLRDPNLEGVVPSLVQYKDSSGEYWLFATNGYVKKKAAKASPGNWTTVSQPGGNRCGKLVVITDSNGDQTLYALAQSGSEWSSFQGIYEYNDSNDSWTEIGYTNGPTGARQVQIGPSSSGFYAVAYTGSDSSDGGMGSSYDVYEYNGSSWSSLGSISESPIGFGGDYILTKYRPYQVSGGSISVISDTLYVSGYGGLLPGNEYDNKGMCVNGNNLYVLTDDYLWHYNGSSWNGRTGTGTSSYDGFGTPAYFAGSQPLVLMPLEEGYREAIIGSSGTISGTQTVGASSSSTVATSSRSQYRSTIDDYSIDFMFAVTDSEYLPDGCSYAVFASIGHYKYSGLWGYYENVQPEWNRE